VEVSLSLSLPVAVRDSAFLEPETASRSPPLEVRPPMHQRHAVSNTPPAPRWPVELFPIRGDHRIDHLATQQALPAKEGEGRASRILQADGHHQTMTAKAVHELTPGFDTAHGLGTPTGSDPLYDAWGDGQEPRPFELCPARYERRRLLCQGDAMMA